jgi:hypothetical protein
VITSDQVDWALEANGAILGARFVVTAMLGN